MPTLYNQHESGHHLAAVLVPFCFLNHTIIKMSQVLEEKRDEMRCESSTLSCALTDRQHTYTRSILCVRAGCNYTFAYFTVGWRPRILTEIKQSENCCDANAWVLGARMIIWQSIKLNDVTARWTSGCALWKWARVRRPKSGVARHIRHPSSRMQPSASGACLIMRVHFLCDYSHSENASILQLN